MFCRLDTKIKTLSNQLDTLNREKLAEEIVKKEKDKEIQQLKQKVKELDDAKGRVQNELDKAQKEIRKLGALSLEMRDFEVSVI
jgi:seryl-tRNA synthetase